MKLTIDTGAVINHLSYSVDNGKIVAAGADNHLRVYDANVAADAEDLAAAALLQDQTAAGPLLAFTGIGTLAIAFYADD